MLCSTTKQGREAGRLRGAPAAPLSRKPPAARHDAGDSKVRVTEAASEAASGRSLGKAGLPLSTVQGSPSRGVAVGTGQ